MTKAVATSFWLKRILDDGEKAEFGWKLRDFKRSWPNDEPLRRLGEFLHAYLVFGDAHQANHYFVQDPFHLQAFILREGFELFLFGHELGHIIAGQNLDSAPEAPHMMGAMVVEASISNWIWSSRQTDSAWILRCRRCSTTAATLEAAIAASTSCSRQWNTRPGEINACPRRAETGTGERNSPPSRCAEGILARGAAAAPRQEGRKAADQVCRNPGGGPTPDVEPHRAPVQGPSR